MKLTAQQIGDLRRLSDPEHHIRSRSITNSTLSALQRRGLAKIERVRSEHVENHMDWMWRITPSGRRALEQSQSQEGK